MGWLQCRFGAAPFLFQVHTAMHLSCCSGEPGYAQIHIPETGVEKVQGNEAVA